MGISVSQDVSSNVVNFWREMESQVRRIEKFYNSQIHLVLVSNFQAQTGENLRKLRPTLANQQTLP